MIIILTTFVSIVLLIVVLIIYRRRKQRVKELLSKKEKLDSTSYMIDSTRAKLSRDINRVKRKNNGE